MKKDANSDVIKSTKPYKVKFFSKILYSIGIIVTTTTLFVGTSFILSACSSTNQTTDTPVSDVQDDSNTTESPDDSLTENSSNEPEDLTEDPNIDTPDQETDPEDVDTPTDPEIDPETPTDQTDSETPTDSKTAPTTLEELMQEGNEEYQAIVLSNLNDYLFEIILSRTIGSGYDVNAMSDTKREIIGNESGEKVEKIRLHGTYTLSDTNESYKILSVTPVETTELTIKDLVDDTVDVEKLEEVFDTSRYGAIYSTNYTFNYDPSIQTEKADLLDAVNTKLFEDGLISEVDENTESFIKDYGTSINPTLGGTARIITIMNLTETGYEEVDIRIKENQGNNNDETLIENLKNGNYYVYNKESSEFTGAILNNSNSQDE